MLSCNSNSIETPEEEEEEEEEETIDTDWNKESRFTQSELNKIATLKGMLPEIVITGFEIKYLEWVITWLRPENRYNTHSRHYAECDEYERLSKYSLQYGYAILPLIFEKLNIEQLYAKNLLEDLTFPKYKYIYDDIRSYLYSKVVPGEQDLPSTLSFVTDYSKKLLEKEYENMLKSIQNISIPGDEALALNTVPMNGGDRFCIFLYSENEETALVRIYNSDGEIEYESNYNLHNLPIINPYSHPIPGEVIIDISNLREGIYVLQITIGSKTISAKFERQSQFN